MKLTKNIILLCTAALLLEGCGEGSKTEKDEPGSTTEKTDTSSVLSENEFVKGTGTVKYIPIEGGFYGIIGDDGKKYLTKIPPELREDGLRVSFEGRIRKDVATTVMWGIILEPTKIEKLQ